MNQTSRGVLKPAYLVLLLIFFVGLALRLYALDADSLWGDEIFTVTTSGLDLRSLPSFLARSDTHPPMVYVTTKLIVEVFGSSEFVLRLPAALLGSVSVLLLYKVGAMLWGQREGLAGAFLLCISPYHIHYSQEVRHYSLMVSLALLSLIFLLQALRRGQTRMWILFALCTILNIYTHDFAFFVLASEVLFAAWVILEDWRSSRDTAAQIGHADSALAETGPESTVPEDPPSHATPANPVSRRLSGPTRQAVHLIAALALVGVSYLPWSPFLWQQLHGSTIQFEGLGAEAASDAAISIRFIGEAFHTYLDLPGALLLLIAALFVLGVASSRARYIVLLGTWVAIPFLFPFIVRFGHSFYARHALFVVPIFFLGMARGISILTDLLARRLDAVRGHLKWRLPVTLLLAAAVIGVLNVAPLKDYYTWQKTDFRGVALTLAANLHPGDVVLVDGTGFLDDDSTYVRPNLSYYMARFGASDIRVLPVGPGLGRAIRGSSADDGGEVWAILYHHGQFPGAEAQDAIVTTGFQDLAVVRLRQPSFDLRHDTTVMLDMLIEILPEPDAHFDLHLALAEMYASMGEDAEAAKHVELAKSSAPQDASAHRHLAQSYTEQGLLEDAVTEYLMFLQTPSGQTDGKWRQQVYWDLGVIYEELGALDEAARAYEQLVSTNPMHLQAHLRLGSLYTQLNEPGQALAVYQRALEIEPENPELHLVLGGIYQGLGRVEEATLAYQEVLRLDPSNEWAGTRLRLFSHPFDEDMPHPLLRSVGQQLALLGYDIRPATVEAGGSIQVTLWWQAVGTMDRDYTVFIHLADSQGLIWAQYDGLLTDSGQPTSAWRLGLTVRGDYRLELAPDAPPGDYELTTGVYYWETGERLPVWDEKGQRLDADMIQLTTLSVSR